MIQTSPQTILFISHHEDFLTQTADTIIHLRQIKHRKEAETIVEHLGYQDYSSQREQQFKQQSQQAANDQRTYRKTMEKHRRVRQQVETSLRNTKDSTAGRLLAKKMKSLLSQEKALRARIPIHELPNPMMRKLSIFIFLPSLPCLLKNESFY